jgi:hypothetical protein
VPRVNDPEGFFAEMRAEIERERARHAKERVARGLGPEAGDGRPGQRVDLFATPQAAAAPPGQEWRVLDDMPLGASRIGWLPDLPPGVPWPMLGGRKLPFVAQLNLADLPPSGERLLPADGWLYAFARVGNAQFPDPVAGVFLHRGSAAAELVRPERPDDNEVWPDWNREVVYNGVPVTAVAPVERADGRGGASRSPVGWLFGGDCGFGTAGQFADQAFLDGDDWINLLAVASVGTLQWSDCGHLYFMSRHRDLAAGDYTQVLAAVGSS